MLNEADAIFLLKLMGAVIVLIILFLWLTEPDPYEEVESQLYEEDARAKAVCCEPNGCAFGKDVGMPEYHCTNKCQYEIFREQQRAK